MFKADERENDNSELFMRLKDWNAHKRDYELLTFAKKAQEAGLVELDENQIKIMIIKLQQIEKLLKEVGKNKKKVKDQPLVKQTTNNRRRSNASSTLQAFQNSFGKKNLASGLKGAI